MQGAYLIILERRHSVAELTSFQCLGWKKSISKVWLRASEIGVAPGR